MLFVVQTGLNDRANGAETKKCQFRYRSGKRN